MIDNTILNRYHAWLASDKVSEEMKQELTAIEGNANSNAQNVSESIESATIIFATLPILVVYPFVQRYFVSGVTIGAVKG